MLRLLETGLKLAFIPTPLASTFQVRESKFLFAFLCVSASLREAAFTAFTGTIFSGLRVGAQYDKHYLIQPLPFSVSSVISV
jgi:hypothetical protein